MGASTRRARPRLSTYTSVVGQLDLEAALLVALERNDLLPPRPDDAAGGEVATRFLAALKQSLVDGAYEANRALFVPVSKPRYATRPAALLTLADRVVYHALVDPLRPRIERALVSDRALLWPRGENSAKQWNSFELAPLELPGDYIVRTDVAGFYESIDHTVLHNWLLSSTGKIDLVEALIDFLGQIMGESRGLPQGISTSDTLATAYLAEVDAAMLRHGYPYWRHGDDIRVLVVDHDVGRQAVHHFEAELRAVRLLLNAEKTRVLHRATYTGQIDAVDQERVRVQQALTDKREAGLLEASDEDIEELVDQAGLDEETKWELLYHHSISIEDIVEELRPHLQPSQVEVARATYDEATRRAPDSRVDGALSPEMFHGILTTSFTRLIAARDPHALEDAASLIFRFPDETELVATYLRALAASHSAEVGREVTRALTDGYLTAWQRAWLFIVVRDVIEAAPGADLSAAVDAARAIATSEGESWLARSEAARVLAHAGLLEHELVTRMWAAAPTVIRADLAAAVATLSATTAPPAWVEPFLDSLGADAMLQVVLARTRAGAAAQSQTANPQMTASEDSVPGDKAVDT